MKKLYTLVAVALPFFAFSQTRPNTNPRTDSTTSTLNTNTNANSTSNTNSNTNTTSTLGSASTSTPTKVEQEGAANKRISIIVGAGASYYQTRLWLDPAVSPINNLVKLQQSKNIKTNLSIGIAYTPHTYDVINTITSTGPNNELIQTQRVENVQKGWTGALFINPVALSKINESQSFFVNPDFGVGFGYRFAGGLSLLATGEFFWVKQPREWFIDEFSKGDKTYSIGNQIQKTVDMNDNNIVYTKPVFSIGFKLCYSFDIIKNFVSTTTTSTTSAATTSNPANPTTNRTTTTTTTGPGNQ